MPTYDVEMYSDLFFESDMRFIDRAHGPLPNPVSGLCHNEPPQDDCENGEFYADLSSDGFAGGAAFVPLSSIAEQKRWYDLSYEEAKDLAMEAKAFRSRPNATPGSFLEAHGRPRRRARVRS